MAARRTQGEGALFQRGRRGGRAGQWVARVEVRGRGQKPYRKEFTGATPAEATAKRDRFLDRKRDGFTMPRGREPSVSDWLLHWLHNVARKEVEATTWERSYRQKITDLVCPYFEQVPLSDLCEEDIEEWHAQLEVTTSVKTGKPLSASTIGQAHRIMSRGIKIAVVRGRLPRNPCSNVSPPTVEELELEPPTAAEVVLILDRCRTWPNGARWILAITTGLRQGEALGLEWPRVHVRPPASLDVEWAAAWVKGQRILKRPKSKASRRSVPLAARMVTGFTEHKKQQVKAELAAKSWEKSDVVFTDAAGRPVSPWTDARDWRLLLADLGLPRYRVHDLRHGYATMLLEAGVDPRVVKEMLGHASLALLGRYQHVRPVMHAAVADAIDAVLGDGSMPPDTPPQNLDNTQDGENETGASGPLRTTGQENTRNMRNKQNTRKGA